MKYKVCMVLYKSENGRAYQAEKGEGFGLSDALSIDTEDFPSDDDIETWLQGKLLDIKSGTK